MLNAAQTEMHAVVRGGAVAEWIEHPPVFSNSPSLVTSVTERYFIHLGVHYASSGNICGARVKNGYISPWLDTRYISIYLGLQLAIRDQSRTAERWLNVLFGLAAGRHWRCDTWRHQHGDQVSHTVAISTSPHPGSRSQLGRQSISY